MRFSRFYYLLSLLFVFVIPTIFIGVIIWEKILWLNFIVFILLITLIGSVWDNWATRHGKRDKVWIWQFNRKNTIGINFLDIPIEEYLFYVFTSVYVVFIWKSIEVALEAKSLLFFLLIPIMGLWSLLFISLPYKWGTK